METQKTRKTPEQIEALKVQGLNKKQDKQTLIRQAQLIAEKHGLNFVYIRPWNTREHQPVNNGGMVIAYKVPFPGASVIEMSTSVCHVNDNFDKVMGKVYACNNFQAGRTVQLKLPEGTRYSQQLREVFSEFI